MTGMFKLVKAAALTSLLSLGGTGLSAQEPTTYPPEFAAQVRQYLLDNPEVILEAMEILSTRQAASEMALIVAPAYDAILNAGPDLRIGREDAETLIIEFFDYRCAVCKAALPTLEAFVADNPNVAFIKKHLPIISPGSERATRYVLAADSLYGTEVSTNLHKALYATKAPMREEVFKGEAERLDLDHAAIQALTQSDAITALIDANRDMAIDLGISGTPAFMSATKLKVGAVSADDLAALITN